MLYIFIILSYSINFYLLVYKLNFTDDKFATDICQLRMKPDDFNLIKVIGRGAFGEVQLVSIIMN